MDYRIGFYVHSGPFDKEAASHSMDEFTTAPVALRYFGKWTPAPVFVTAFKLPANAVEPRRSESGSVTGDASEIEQVWGYDRGVGGKGMGEHETVTVSLKQFEQILKKFDIAETTDKESGLPIYYFSSRSSEARFNDEIWKAMNSL